MSHVAMSRYLVTGAFGAIGVCGRYCSLVGSASEGATLRRQLEPIAGPGGRGVP